MSGKGEGGGMSFDSGNAAAQVDAVVLGMGCFWSPEALFGSLPGVVRTCTGYAGGTAPAPTYRRMGDHSETVQIEYDTEIVTIERLLHLFWDSHNPDNINDYKGRQYKSLLIYRADNQSVSAQAVLRQRRSLGKAEPDTEIVPYTAFYPAEERHQKYYLKRYPQAVEAIVPLFATDDEAMDSTLAARLNGLAKGHTNLSRIKEEIGQWKLGSEERERIAQAVSKIRW